MLTVFLTLKTISDYLNMPEHDTYTVTIFSHWLSSFIKQFDCHMFNNNNVQKLCW